MESLQEIERKEKPTTASTPASQASSGKQSYEQRKEQEKQIRKIRKSIESIESNLADIERQIATYDEKFATAIEYNEADYGTYNELKARYDKQMHEWEKACYELELIEEN